MVLDLTMTSDFAPLAAVPVAVALWLGRGRWRRGRQGRGSLIGLSRLAAGFTVPVVAIDHAGSIAIFNAQAEALTGWRREEVIGQSVSMLMPEPHRRRHGDYVADYLEDREAGRRPPVVGAARVVDVVHRDGQQIPCQIYISEYRNGWQGFWSWLQPLRTENAGGVQ